MLTAADLTQFHGTETWYRHALLRNVTYTEGVQYLAKEAGAYWLIDEIAINNKFNSRLREEEFQVWKLRCDGSGSGADLTVEDGNGNCVFSKRIDFTDFPLPEIDLWFTGNVIMLPSEY